MPWDFEIRKKIIDNIQNNFSFALVSHKNPDGDALGSLIALEQTLLNLNKKVDIFILDKIKPQYKPLFGENRVGKNFTPSFHKTYDVVFMLDVSDPFRTGIDIKNLGKKIIVIDHHINNKKFGDIYYCRDVSSTTILIYKIIKNLIDITPLIATALYFGIVTDTSGFKNQNTNKKTHYISGHLLNLVDLNIIKSMLNPLTIYNFMLMSEVFKNYQFINTIYCKIVYLVISQNDIIASGSNYDDASSLIDYIKEISNIDAALIFIEGQDNVYVRCRSNTIDISEIMRHFNGGGHQFAAGASITSNDLKGTVEEVIAFAQKYIGNVVKKREHLENN